MSLGRFCIYALLVVGFLAAEEGSGQISPGPLSAPHSRLEGSDRCLECHSQKQRIAAAKCLECHELLRERIDQGQGYHATLTDQGCERCHMEHHGQEFQLVYWGEAGQDAFDHSQAGFRLEGSHASLSCRSCHKASLVKEVALLESLGKDLSRTFLGLDGSSCRSCHLDEHRGQFGNRACDSCHGLEKWNQGNRFRHETSRFPLRGKHQQVACERCHSARTTAGEVDAPIQYTGLRFSRCTDCHQDPHTGRLGASCSQCHSENGWRRGELKGFDHKRTRFALEGAHRRVNCRGCHPSGVTVPIAAFKECSDCHDDRHRGQFAASPGGIECNRCHSIDSFETFTFDLDAHQETDYPLEGAHLAVACDSCHIPLSWQASPGEALASMRRARGIEQGSVNKYSFPSTLCSSCHGRPHEAGLDRFMLEKDCRTCHEVAGWRRVDFDHERTDYSLAGAHQRVECVDCHRVVDPQGETQRLRFDGLEERCSACHQDPHRGQFADEAAVTACNRCHSPESWKRLSFEHNRDSTFALDGVHARVACRDCHPSEGAGEGVLVRYKPLRQACQDCHSGQQPPNRTRS